MRILLGAAIIALLFDSTGSAQSLGDVARQERARRETSAIDTTIYTTESIRAQYAPAVAALQPVDPELPGSLEDLRDSLLQFSEDLSPPTGGLLEAGTGGDGAMVEMLESFEAGSLEEIERLETELADPSISDEERSALESALIEAEQVLSEVRTELVPARLQLGELQAAVTAECALVQELEDNEVRQSLAITATRGRVTAPTGSQQERNQAQVELAIAVSQLTDIRTALDEARIELERLEADRPEQ